MTADLLATMTPLVAAATSPFFVTLLALSVGVILLWIRRDHAAGAATVTAAVLALWLMGSAPIADRFLGGLESYHFPLLDSAALPDSVWVVVLGGGAVGDSRLPPNSWLSESSMARLAEGIRIHRASRGSTLVLSGAGIHDSISTARSMAETAVLLGVDPAGLVTHESPRNTAEEVDRVHELMDGRPLVVVTSASHMPRAVRLFEARGIDVIPAPTHYLALDRRNRTFRLTRLVPSGENVRKVERAVYEILARARRR